ncbi:hypothetical protein [Ktedonobacter racemifer]|uniref:hypothetical protein n=1 Tax=Ktedonobacter racemifer TaxID=363277 RepID=UPI001B7F8686|nr:hypothetical protein [Ktedonobacter racemifer]
MMSQRDMKADENELHLRFYLSMRSLFSEEVPCRAAAPQRMKMAYTASSEEQVEVGSHTGALEPEEEVDRGASRISDCRHVREQDQSQMAMQAVPKEQTIRIWSSLIVLNI